MKKYAKKICNKIELNKCTKKYSKICENLQKKYEKKKEKYAKKYAEYAQKYADVQYAGKSKICKT